MRFAYVCAVIITMILGCSTPSKKVPIIKPNTVPDNVNFGSDKDKESIDFYLQKMAQKNPANNVQWWVNYKRALLWKEDNLLFSCDKFIDLAKVKNFPLSQVAYLRAHEVCPAETPQLKDLTKFNFKDFPDWMQKTALDVALFRAKRTDNLPDVMNLSYEKSKLFLPKREKEFFTEEALKIAKRLEDKKKINQFQSRLNRLAPRHLKKPKRSQYLKVARDFRDQREFDKAREYYLKVIKSRRSSFSKKLKALKGLRMAYKLERDKPSYLQATRDLAAYVARVYKRNRKSKYFRRVYHDIHLKLVRTMWTLDRYSEANALLKKLGRELKGKYTLSEIFWLRGRMLEERGEFRKAVWWFEQSIGELKGRSEFKEKVKWYTAWNYRKIGETEKAVEKLNDLAENTPNPFSRSRYLFWLARSQKDLNQINSSKETLKKLTEEDPLGYYGLIAHREMSQMLATSELKQQQSATEKRKKLKDPLLETILDTKLIEWLVSTGENELAKNYLNGVSKTYRKKRKSTDEGWLKLFYYFAKSGSYLSLYTQLGYLDAVTRERILNQNPDIIFPKPYFDDVAQASSQFGISVEFIYSIMRQESAFNPQARSPADAFGLMQLLPEVAQKTSELAQVPYQKAEDLYHPHINIPIGSAYLRELWDKYNGQFILTVASYNASDEAIRGWLKTRYRGQSLEFIEDIPYEETRGYVRLVMRNLIFYQMINSSKDQIPFPEWCLEINPGQLAPPEAEQGA